MVLSLGRRRQQTWRYRESNTWKCAWFITISQDRLWSVLSWMYVFSYFAVTKTHCCRKLCGFKKYIDLCVKSFLLSTIYPIFHGCQGLMYILICYHNVLYLLKCKLLFCIAIMILLGCCEFSPNVTCVRINVCSKSPYHMLPGRDRRLRAAWSGDASGSFGKQGKNRGRDIDSLNDKIHI